LEKWKVRQREVGWGGGGRIIGYQREARGQGGLLIDNRDEGLSNKG